MAASFPRHLAGNVNYRRPTYLGILASGLLTVLVIVGSRNLEHFDSALFGYTIASIVARCDRLSVRGMAATAGNANLLASRLAALSRTQKTI